MTTNNQTSITKRILLFSILTFTLFLAACGSSDEWEPVVSNVESIEFTKSDTGSKIVRIETEHEVLITSIYAIEYRTDSNGDSTTFTQRVEDGENWTSIKEWLFGQDRPYELLIPEKQLKQISTDYADTFGETFVHAPK